MICKRCGSQTEILSSAIRVCVDCARSAKDDVIPLLLEAHQRSRMEFGLGAAPPKDASGVKCRRCANECRMGEGERGYCGLRENRNGRLASIGAVEDSDSANPKGLVDWYYDALPTNCVADWVCPGGTGAGYPRFAHTDGPESGFKNLAVFCIGCTFDCLYCQNWRFRERLETSEAISAQELADRVDEETSCVCYFGGDPTPQLHHALSASRRALEARPNRILRICWETNGSMNRAQLKEMADLSLKSGGCIKFDLKAWHETLHLALTGVSNKRTFENFAYVAGFVKERPDPPLLIASTPLVPGYVDEHEVRNIAEFIAGFSLDIPYALLAFHPDFYMPDLPTTSREQARACENAARGAGLERVRIGNRHLLS